MSSFKTQPITNPPCRMVFENGRIKMKDGSSLRKYLSSWAKVEGIEDGEDISIVNRAGLVGLAKDATLMRNWGA